MSWGDLGLLVLAFLVFCYLLAALIDPERFG
jgi:K+-transporting ATPase KdpF subunit